MTDLIYKITVESFTLRNEVYNVAITPELYAEDDGLDFTGNYQCLLIHPQHGSMQFLLSPDDFYLEATPQGALTESEKIGWVADPSAYIEPDIILELEKIIDRMNNGTAKQF